MSVGRNRWSHREGRWNSRPQTAVWAAVIIVDNPLNQRAFQVSLRKRDLEVQALSPDGAYQSFAITIRLRTSHRRAQHSNSQALHSMVQLFRVDPIPVMDQISVWVISGSASRNCCSVHSAVGWAVTL
jgi:hypothetical protein